MAFRTRMGQSGELLAEPRANSRDMACSLRGIKNAPASMQCRQYRRALQPLTLTVYWKAKPHPVVAPPGACIEKCSTKELLRNANGHSLRPPGSVQAQMVIVRRSKAHLFLLALPVQPFFALQVAIRRARPHTLRFSNCSVLVRLARLCCLPLQ